MSQSHSKSPIGKAVLLASLSIASITFPVASNAQNSAGPMLEEVIVTAQKRAESLRDVPISVAAVSGNKLDEAGIEDLTELSSYVPGLRVVDGTLEPRLFIRGIGSGGNQGFEQSVGTYLDGVYIGRGLQSRSAFMDLERVEVLRGPQSILFGQSSIAGAISLVSAKPSAELEGGVSVSYTDEIDGLETNAYVSGPITDSLSARLAVRDRRQDGFMFNRLQGVERPELDEQSARLSLAWDAGALSANFKAEVNRLDRKGRPLMSNDLGIYPILGPIGTHGPIVQDTSGLGFDLWSNTPNEFEFETDNFVLNLDYDLAGHTLTSLTSYSEYEYSDNDYDADATEVDFILLQMGESFEQFSQEFRIVSPGDGPISYIAGLFYQTSDLEYREEGTLKLSSLGLDVLAGLPVGLLDFTNQTEFQQTYDTYSAFGQVTWSITDRLRVDLGVRYTRDEKDAKRDAIAISELVPGVPISQIPIGGGLFISDVIADAFNIVDHSIEDDFGSDNWVPSVNVQYDLTGDTMLYISYQEGFKAAGFDARGANDWTENSAPPGKEGPQLGGSNFFYDQENAESYELGLKTLLLDGAAEMNLAIYRTDYTDMQVSLFDGSFGFIVNNAGAARVQGVDLDGRWALTQNLTMTGSVSYLDFEWVEYLTGACNGANSLPVSPVSPSSCDYTGQENNYTPELTANVSLDHVMDLGPSLELRSTLDVNYMSEQFASPNLDPRLTIPDMALINARVSVGSSNGRWQVAFIGKNLTDEEYITLGGALPSSQTGTFVGMALPRTLAVEGRYQF